MQAIYAPSGFTNPIRIAKKIASWIPSLVVMVSASHCHQPLSALASHTASNSAASQPPESGVLVAKQQWQISVPERFELEPAADVLPRGFKPAVRAHRPAIASPRLRPAA